MLIWHRHRLRVLILSLQTKDDPMEIGFSFAFGALSLIICLAFWKEGICGRGGMADAIDLGSIG